MRHPSGTAHPFAKSVKGWGTRTRIKFPTSRKSGEKWGTRTRIKFPTSRKSGEKWGTQLHPAHTFAKSAKDGAPAAQESPPFKKREGWGTRPDQIPHFSQKRREMGHPSGSNSPLLAKAARNGAPERIEFPTSRKSGEKWGTQLHLAHPFAKSAKDGAPARIKFPTSRKSGEKWGTQLHSAHPFAKSAKDGAPARIKFPTSRKSGEKWGTQLHLAHPFAKSAKGWSTRPDQIPHFSQKRREMGHPAAPRPPFRKRGEGWGTRPDQIPHFSQKRREMGHPYVLSFPRLEFPRLAKPARNGAPREKWGIPAHPITSVTWGPQFCMLTSICSFVISDFRTENLSGCHEFLFSDWEGR